MNLVIVPFHDWRKNIKEGFRTRDAHFIQEFEQNNGVANILIINRPITLLEIFLRKLSFSLPGKTIVSKGKFKLVKMSHKLYVVDFISIDFINQILKKQEWFINKYQDKSYINFINESIAFLGMNSYNLIIQNVFSGELSDKLNPDKVLFDAWDNFLKFPSYVKIRKHIKILYHKLSLNTHLWISNSLENIKYFNNHFKLKNIQLIKNGVSHEMFLGTPNKTPEDLINIPLPITGFGGKITHLLDVDLINYLIIDNPKMSFVFVGQILNKSVFKKLLKAKNFYYLGDKHYNSYPEYIKIFDTLIVPYHVKDKQHGGDSIKVYEYLATGKKVIGTRGNGLEDLEEYAYIVDSPETFSYEIKKYNINNKKRLNFNHYSWRIKAKRILELLKE